MLKFIAKTEKIMGSIVKAAVLVSIFSMVALVFLNVVLRYIFNSGIPVGEEISRYFFIWTVFLGVILAFRDKEHIGVTILIDALKGKMKKIMTIVGNIITSLAICYMLVSSIAYLKIAHTYTTPATGIPFSFIAFSLVISSFSILLLNIFDLYKLLKKRKGDEGNWSY